MGVEKTPRTKDARNTGVSSNCTRLGSNQHALAGASPSRVLSPLQRLGSSTNRGSPKCTVIRKSAPESSP